MPHAPTLFILAVTGGIATGKSTFTRLLHAALPAASSFDADAEVQSLLTDPRILAKLAEEFGDSILLPDGQLDRPRLREQVFDSAEQRAALENILHPEVRMRFEDRRESAATAASASPASQARAQPLLIADIPLLFESNYPFAHDLSVTLAATTATQIDRLCSRPGISRDLASNIISAQMPIPDKMARADVVIWNEGRLERLEQHTNDFLQWLRTITTTTTRRPPKRR